MSQIEIFFGRWRPVPDNHTTSSLAAYDDKNKIYNRDNFRLLVKSLVGMNLMVKVDMSN